MIDDYYGDLTLGKAAITVDDYGIESSTFSEFNIQGVINQAGSKEIEFAKSRGIDVDYKAYVEVSITTLLIKKDDLINGYRVVSDPKNTLHMDHHLKILLKEVI